MRIREAAVLTVLVVGVGCTRGKYDTSLGERDPGGAGAAGAAGSPSGGVPGSEVAGAAGQRGGGAGIGGGAGTAGAAGAASGGEPPECASNEDCIDSHYDEPYVCQDARCVSLRSNACPVVLGAGDANLEYLRAPAPIIVGAYSNFEPLSTIAKSAYNYELAFEEFNAATVGGLPGGPNGTRRPLIAVVCTSRDDDLRPSLDHLVDELAVSGILAALPDDKLQTAFEYTHDQLGANVFFLSPYGANEALRTLADDGLLWHMLGDTADLADPFVPLVARAEAFQNALRRDPTEPMKVLVVQSDYSFNSDLAELAVRNIVFNGYGALDAENHEYLQRVLIESAMNQSVPDVSAAVDALDPNDPPQIVLAFTTRELFESVIPDFELAFDEGLGEPRPLYLLSPMLANDSAVLGAAEDLPTLRDRLVGVNVASWGDQLYQQYLARLQAAFPEASLELASTENYYDAAYFLMYSFAAAGEFREYDGYDLAFGMRRLIRDDVPTDPCAGAEGCFEIDDMRIVATVNHLLSADADAAGIGLVGTMGPPRFDRTQGVRFMASSVWCVDDDGSGGLEFVPDVLDYHPEAQTLRGTFSCFADF